MLCATSRKLLTTDGAVNADGAPLTHGRALLVLKRFAETYPKVRHLLTVDGATSADGAPLPHGRALPVLKRFAEKLPKA